MIEGNEAAWEAAVPWKPELPGPRPCHEDDAWIVCHVLPTGVPAKRGQAAMPAKNP
jgi:hypothetical protein